MIVQNGTQHSPFCTDVIENNVNEKLVFANYAYAKTMIEYDIGEKHIFYKPNLFPCFLVCKFDMTYNPYVCYKIIMCCFCISGRMVV